MAESSVAITAGSGTAIATFLDSASANRQVVVVGDQASNVASVDSSGALLVSESNKALTNVTGGLSTSTAVLTADSTSDVAKAGSVTVYLYGTHVGFNVTFEISPDGTNWFPVTAQRTDTGVLTSGGTTGTLSSSSSLAYDVSPLLGVQQFRVRATARTSGTLNVVISPAIRAAEVAPTIVPSGTQTVSVSGTPNVTADTEMAAAAALGDGKTAALTTATVGAVPELYNGTTVDFQRANTSGNVIAAGTTTTNAGVTVTTYNARFAVIVVNVSAVTGGNTLTVTISGVTATGSYTYPILVSTALSATGVTPLRIGVGLTPSPNAVANDVLPRSLKVATTVAGTGTITYGIDYILSA